MKNIVLISSPYDYTVHPHINCMGSHDLSGKKDSEDLRKKVEGVDMEVFLDFGFPIGASVNGVRFVTPKNHMYSDQAVIQNCNVDECQDKPCYCTQIVGKFFWCSYSILGHTSFDFKETFLDLPPNKSVQMVLSNIVDSGHHNKSVLRKFFFKYLRKNYDKRK